MDNAEFPQSFSNISARFLWHIEGKVLLSKLQTSISFKNKNKSFKYILRRIDHNTDPCATPHNNSLLELNVILFLTLCVLLFN